MKCSTAYSDLDPDHSQCKDDVGKEIVVSEKLQQQLVDKHNEYRSMVKDASDMLQLKWDSDLASTASKWARQCKGGHDAYSSRAEPNLPGVMIGQNAAAGHPGLMEALEGWYSEYVNFTYGMETDAIVGHYTQIITAKTGLIGCGEADCSIVDKKYKRHQVCNYAPGQSSFTIPYAKGDACSACKTCDSAKKLCVCADTVCYNGGKLSVTDCTCKCGYGFSGDLCEKKDCNEDKSQCDLYYNYFKDKVNDPCSYSNIEREICPKRCGFC